MTSANPIESFQNVYGVKCVFQYYEKVKVANALDFDEALENFEVLYKKMLAASAPSQSSKFCDVLVDESKIQTAGSKHKGGVVVKPPQGRCPMAQIWAVACQGG